MELTHNMYMEHMHMEYMYMELTHNKQGMITPPPVPMHGSQWKEIQRGIVRRRQSLHINNHPPLLLWFPLDDGSVNQWQIAFDF